MAENTQLRTNGLQQLNAVLNNDIMKKKFQNILSENAGAFMASIIELYQSDSGLQSCNPNAVVLEALKAATLKLPINKQLGFAYIISYKINGVPTPQFQMGYRGLIQLAMRSGQYKYLNADIVYEGEKVTYSRVTGMLEIEGEAISEKAIGYFAYFKLLNGFEKSLYWSKDKVVSHAKRYSKSYNKSSSPWQTDFDAMALKTVIRNLLSKYGVMSIEFANAFASDADDESIEAEIAERGNKTPLMIPDARVEIKPEEPDANEATAAPSDDMPEEAGF